MVRRLASVSQVGVCGGEFSSHTDAQDWLHTIALDIEEPFQGQGIGRYLLQYALQEMHKIGYQPLRVMPVTFTVDLKEGRGQLPSCILKADYDGEEVGMCESICGCEFWSHTDAQDWLHTNALDIEEHVSRTRYRSLSAPVRASRDDITRIPPRRLVRIGRTTERSSFPATVVIALWIGPERT